MNRYRFGFNGKENDNEVKGKGNQQDYGDRNYDTRLGKFLSLDPIAASFPWNSPYSYAENDPIQNIDLDGLEKYHYTRVKDNSGKTTGLSLTRVEDYTITKLEWKEQTRSLFGITFKVKVPTLVKIKNPAKVYVVHQQTSTWIVKHRVGPVKIEYDEHQDFKTYNAAANSTDKDFSWTDEDATWNFVNALNAGADCAMENSFSRVLAGGSSPKTKFAQDNHSNNFSKTGQKILGVKSIPDAVSKLKSGEWTADKLPIDYVIRDGTKYLLNTRSVATLKQAGIPQSQWKYQNQTGNETFEKNLTNNLNGSKGYDQVTNRSTGTTTKL